MHAGYWLQRSAQRFPNNVLWITPARNINYKEGSERVNQLGHALLEKCKIKLGTRVAVLSCNRFEGLEVFLGTMSAGLTPVPMNPRAHPQEHAYMINDSGSEFVIYSDDFSEHIEKIRPSCPGVKTWVRIGEHQGQDIDYESFLSGNPTTPPPNDINPEDIAWLFYTSGTTGQPKGAMETHRNLVTMCQQFLLGIIPDVVSTDVMFHLAPISHGTASCMFPHLAVGAANAFPSSKNFDPEQVFEAIQRHKITSTFLAPTMITLLLRSPKVRDYDLSSLKNVIYGGGPMYVNQLKEALDIFGNVFVQIYGQGEAPMTVCALPKEEHLVGDDPHKIARLRSCGREMPGVRVAILDENDRPLPVGEMGEVCVKSDLVMKGYWNRAEASSETLKGGWLHTGDVGYLDENGYLFLTDRKKDLIISGGSNIYPREVEEVLCRHPAVSEVAVIGEPDEVWGETVKAVVVAREGHSTSARELIEYCKEHMASYKKPSKVVFVNELPKNATGKVLKRQLKDSTA